MKSIGQMLERCEGLVGTQDVNQWENEFLSGVIRQFYDNDQDSTCLSSKQVEVIERIYKKHYGD